MPNHVVHFGWLECDTLLLGAKQKMPKETGGILMGYEWRGVLKITDIVGPGPNAIHERSSFTPDNDFHEAEMARIYEQSGRIHTYLGDWHTHPGSAAYLSERDKKTLRNIASDECCRLPEPLMIILGTRPFELKTWRYTLGVLRSHRYQLLNIHID